MVKPVSLTIPTEPIGSIPRPVDLIDRVNYLQRLPAPSPASPRHTPGTPNLSSSHSRHTAIYGFVATTSLFSLRSGSTNDLRWSLVQYSVDLRTDKPLNLIFTAGFSHQKAPLQSPDVRAAGPFFTEKNSCRCLPARTMLADRRATRM